MTGSPGTPRPVGAGTSGFVNDPGPWYPKASLLRLGKATAHAWIQHSTTPPAQSDTARAFHRGRCKWSASTVCRDRRSEMPGESFRHEVPLSPGERLEVRRGKTGSAGSPKWLRA